MRVAGASYILTPEEYEPFSRMEAGDQLLIILSLAAGEDEFAGYLPAEAAELAMRVRNRMASMPPEEQSILEEKAAAVFPMMRDELNDGQWTDYPLPLAAERDAGQQMSGHILIVVDLMPKADSPASRFERLTFSRAGNGWVLEGISDGKAPS